MAIGFEPKNRKQKQGDRSKTEKVAAMKKEIRKIPDEPGFMGFQKPDEPKMPDAKKIAEKLDELSDGPEDAKGKRQVTIRLDNEVVDYFENLGMGWRTRINTLLLRYVQSKKRSG